ncbi:hypothetical protein PGTUg99_003531 [Puccinia graminis f. sp. tritici]|nr:hypothetical protein PGTUg99_003531 [Puccinia graminis f. sp. tritici]
MQHQAGGVKIWRPRQVYVGEGIRDYVEIGDRQVAGKSAEEPSKVEHVFSGRHFLASWNGKSSPKL